MYARHNDKMINDKVETNDIAGTKFMMHNVSNRHKKIGINNVPINKMMKDKKIFSMFHILITLSL